VTADDLSWPKARTLLLTGALGLVGTLLLLVVMGIQADVSGTRKDVTEIKLALASYRAQSEAEAKALRDRVDKAEKAIEALQGRK
jgi:hypothetical protein